MINVFWFIFIRECLLTWRRPLDWLNPLLFFILVTILLPLTFTPQIKILQMVGPGILWVALLLSVLWSMIRLFQADFEDGSLEQWLFNPYPLPWLISAKILAHWLMLVVPVLLITPILALMFRLTYTITSVLLFTLILGTPLLTLLGAIGASLTVSLRQGGLLLALILLPLYIPTLIFATAAISQSATGLSPLGSLMWLASLLSLALIIAPWLVALILKIGLSYR